MYSRAVKTSIAYITMRFLKVLKLDQPVIVPVAMGSEVGAMKHKVLNLWRKTLGFPGGTSGKELACQFRRHKTTGSIPGIPWRRAWQPTPVFLLRDPHGQSRLVATVHGVAKSDNWSDLAHMLTRKTLGFTSLCSRRFLDRYQMLSWFSIWGS